MSTLDAVILAGGAGSRMGGVDKPGLAVAGRTLVERVAAAVRAHAPDGRIIVVGPERESPPALYVREDPPGSGPVPALRAGLPHVTAERFALLAADLPHLTGGHLATLEGAVEDVGAVFVDGGGREQWLTGVWDTGAVRAALAAYAGRSLYGLLGPLGPRFVPAPDPDAVADCDTPEDLARAARRLDG
ncbi:molybdenum cofactor guanylyltransferase [Nocardiopsis lambiniae]|uniref:NTP transferase domain-containing protein n=1 Tax=Nocardiopsis lambiniae TaxID=3075539 RepID=A0ABU2MBA1_9ACTN|nr:NTP transferase domain-containing protein [Nocardiopsis sp. DSM 44743]MDT0329959.1 NTP transferase domain-containing protein [Nocardiopsis sp. DSM 44743]